MELPTVRGAFTCMSHLVLFSFFLHCLLVALKHNGVISTTPEASLQVHNGQLPLDLCWKMWLCQEIQFSNFSQCRCSVQSENLRNHEIALRILRILRLCSNLEIAQPISRLAAQSHACNLKIAWFACTIYELSTLPVHVTVSDLLCMCSSQDGRQPW